MQYEFGWLFEPVIQYLNQHKVELYSQHVSGVTAGKLFWPRSHTDPDVWYTVLVCIDYGRGVLSGGDFAFASIGSVLKCQHCSVLIYNPTHHHGTTEFSLYPDNLVSSISHLETIHTIYSCIFSHQLSLTMNGLYAKICG